MRPRLVALVCVLLALSCGRDTPRARKTHLVRLPGDVAPPVAIADDATTYAYRERVDGDSRIVLDGSAGPTFKGVSPPRFAPHTRELFYWAGEPGMDPAGQGFVMAGGMRIGGDFGSDGPLVFTPDGKHWATVAAARRKADAPRAVIVMADGREVGRYPDASRPALSVDGAHVAYLAEREGGGITLVVDGEERATYRASGNPCSARTYTHPVLPNLWPQLQVHYLSDGRLVVMTEDADGWGIYRDGIRLASYVANVAPRHSSADEACRTVAAIQAFSLATAEKAPLTAWWERSAGEEDRWRVLVDGNPADALTCTKYWEIQPPEFSPDGRHLAYACVAEAGTFLVVDGRRYGPYRDMWAYAWAEDGSNIGYGAADVSPERPWRYYVDGEPRSDAFAAVWRPRVEPVGGRIVWHGSPALEGRSVLGIDARRIASFDEVLWGPTLLRPGTATWVIQRGRRVVRLDVPLP